MDNQESISLIESTCKILFSNTEEVSIKGPRKAFVGYTNNPGGDTSISLIYEDANHEAVILENLESAVVYKGVFWYVYTEYTDTDEIRHNVIMNRYTLDIIIDKPIPLHFINRVGAFTLFEYHDRESEIGRVLLIFSNSTGELYKEVKNVIDRRISREKYIEMSIKYRNESTGKYDVMLFTRRGEISVDKFAKDMGYSIKLIPGYKDYLFTCRDNNMGTHIYGLIDTFFQGINYIGEREYKQMLKERENKLRERSKH